MRVLGIETTCDETAAAVVEDGLDIQSDVVASQTELHAPFGGVVPEVASRAHVERLTRVVERALEEAGVAPDALDGLAVASRPGLAGSLVVGASGAKALALAWEKPLVGVHHLFAHLYAVAIAHGPEVYPFLGLVASGGHTSLYACRAPLENEILGSTDDDAAGEAFDKAAALLGLGFPGGPAVERAARGGNPRAHAFPRARLKGRPFDFSFSGLKTALLYAIRPQDPERGGAPGAPRDLSQKDRADLAASFQEAVADALVERLVGAALAEGLERVAAAGGVAANGRLREKLAARAAAEGLTCLFPPKRLCTDSGAPVAGLGFHGLSAPGHAPEHRGLTLAIRAGLERPRSRV